MLDVSQVIESYKDHEDYRYLLELDTLYRHLKMCKPHQFDYDWRDTMADGFEHCHPEYDRWQWHKQSALSYLPILFRFKMFMKEGDYLSAVREIEDIIDKYELDILREDIYCLTIETIEGELCHLQKDTQDLEGN